jgi:hypothetical protein
MPFTGSYTISQGYDPSKFILTDDSSYVDEPANTFTGRKIYLYKVDGTTLVPSGTATTYINFPFADGNSIELSVLEQDMSLDILVEWESSNPQGGSVYELQVVYTFLEYTQQFKYGVIQDWQANPIVINDTGFYKGLSTLNTEISNAEQANRYQDQTAAQNAVERAKYIIDNEQFFF